MAQSFFVDVFANNIKDNPHCFHGPTVLFRRRGDTSGMYFACSACRSRKDCPFYLTKDDYDKRKIMMSSGIMTRENIIKKLRYKKFAQTRKHLKEVINEKRGYCVTCDILFEVSSDAVHDTCNKIIGITDRQLSCPTEMCLQRENDKVEAQYFFSKISTENVLTIIKRLGFKKFLCLGTPRLHENFINSKNGLRSLLLDIDQKYHNFYPRKKFIWYNMFNNFVMDPKNRLILMDFLKTNEELLILLDPPFGGRVELLAATLDSINADFSKVNSCSTSRELSVIWFFPYFMERHIQQSLPNFRMLDYEVNYENHQAFGESGSRRRKAGSAVRIFTNIPLQRFDLNGIPGYRHCHLCNIWVSNKNQHCPLCEACTSKNGTRYIHCSDCKKCVKSSHRHCDTCQRCCLPSHVCGEFQPNTNCYHCHLSGHKRAQCPQLSTPLKKKRKVLVNSVI